MFGPSYEAGCPVNSSIADSFDSLIPHLKARDVTLIAVSGAPIEKLLAYRERMGWSLNWASSYASDFNADLGFSSSPEQTREAIGDDDRFTWSFAGARSLKGIREDVKLYRARRASED